MRILKQSETEATLRRVFFVVVDSATGLVLQTGKAATLAGYLTKKGASPGALAGSFTEVHTANQPGLYYYEATTGELDTIGRLVFRFTCTDCLERTVVTHVGVTREGLSSQLDTVQTDLDNPSQYQANVSALALEANVQDHADAALVAYDPPTRAEATADKAEIIAGVDDVPGAVLEESVTTHKDVANSLAAMLQLLRRRAIGKVVRDENTIWVYDDDQTTVLAEIAVTDTEYGPAT